MNQVYSAIVAVAPAGEHHAAPLIDFDFTALLQLVIFVVMAVVASRFLFKPYLRMREERDAGIDGARAEADRMSAEAEAGLADYEAKLGNARSGALDERRQIRPNPDREHHRRTHRLHGSPLQGHKLIDSVRV